MNLSNGERERLTIHPADDFLPSWSQDNQQIVFYSFRTGNRDIFTMTADGRTKLQLTNDPGADHYPDWSPDGENVVFQSDRTGRYELYILSKEIPQNKRVYILRPCMIHGPNNKGNLNLLYSFVSKGRVNLLSLGSNLLCG